jgi:hypothetical protein
MSTTWGAPRRLRRFIWLSSSKAKERIVYCTTLSVVFPIKVLVGAAKFKLNYIYYSMSTSQLCQWYLT